jgi:ABC-type metal ion transport system substrate-binding protein
VRSVIQVDLAFVFANYSLEAGIDTNSALIVELILTRHKGQIAPGL